MFKILWQQLRISLMLLSFLTLFLGCFYVLLVTGLAQAIFPYQANGSLVVSDSSVLGSRYIGQYFSSPKYFWGRPSATGSFPYNSEEASGSNLGPTNPILLKEIKKRIDILKRDDLGDKKLIPIELVTASASGLDPEISKGAALYQVSRIAKARNWKEAQVIALINKHIIDKQFGFLGRIRVNVLELNMELDGLAYE